MVDSRIASMGKGERGYPRLVTKSDDGGGNVSKKICDLAKNIFSF